MYAYAWGAVVPLSRVVAARAKAPGQGRWAERAKHPDGCWGSRVLPRHENAKFSGTWEFWL
jgi:hypothetical protein